MSEDSAPYNMSSNKPYLVRAFYQWIIDNNCTPYLLVNATHPHTHVPLHAVQNGQIVLNVNPSAVSQMVIDNEAVSFSARFSGVAEQLYIPMSALMAIYAQENGQGMVFSEFEEFEPAEATSDAELDKSSELNKSDDSDGSDDEPPKPPFLKVVK